jgi:polysaccharide biosynthesis/export protein
MEEGDVLFVPKTGIAKFGYVTRNLAAGLSFLTVGAALSK